ncbi:bifunctional hydroxymethylpyrimidine kinase/phosphomethylpyrimidine kinase [Pedomonas mirosovicensis]|uniref:bifunctional hydroxymethylpyrimidine kinase/phosphomethylpyrimidine kinase n=1 Tax=Pedomonas mirosovicensis TaxID=2908641 RepID=UPI0021689A5B|nr:bifunctional hydroxymethylpyrimidine kinase/phosphomethylpyrimidine kinase [Pedomonas mirosovicensis]MCH8684930.1 bifunctional hydroxymethylpyrimidine kinase/phosphomethylpyrimidine kinase [Pedomonas mirosovicensis]
MTDTHDDGMARPKGRVLIVAGSDSGGGAGIQADIKAVTVLGGYAMTAIAALTAQNTEGVFGIHAVPPEFVRQQMTLVLDDIGADVVKTGMLLNAGIIEVVAQELAARAHGVPLVVDPVMVAKGGAGLLADDAVEALRTLLIPHAALVTPNVPEAELLSGRTIETEDDMRAAGEAILALGPNAVLVKGGHRPGSVVNDVLLTREQAITITGPRFDTIHTHGTGCTLASAIATGLAQGLTLHGACERARRFVEEAIRTAPRLGRGHGPLNHLWVLPRQA